MESIKKIIKNKNNIVPLLGVSICTLATAVAVTAIFSPALFGLLSAGTIAALGFTPALLGIIAAFALTIVVASIQQVFTNMAIENVEGRNALNAWHAEERMNVAIESVEGKDGEDGRSARSCMYTNILNDFAGVGVRTGTISENNDTLQLTLPSDNYRKFTKGRNPGDEVSLFVSLFNNGVKEFEVKFAHVAPDAVLHAVTLTAVSDKSAVNDMKAELGMSGKVKEAKFAVSSQSLKSIDAQEVVNSALINPVVNGVVRDLTKPPVLSFGA